MTSLTVAAALAWLISCWLALGVLRSGGFLRRLKRLVGAAVFAALGLLLAALLVLFRAFSAFSSETLLAHVTASRLSPEEFELVYVPVLPPARAGSRRHGPGAQPAPRRARLRGDQWVISGGIVRWHPWLTAGGVTTYQHPMRLSGQFSDVTRQRAHLPTVYELDPGVDWLWEWFYRMDPYLPFVDAAYSSAASVYVEPGVIQDVYATSSGYLIKRR